MKTDTPTVQVTKAALVIRIPWDTLRGRNARERSLTADDVLRLVKAGRRAYKLGNTKLIGSLRDLMP